jgi:hypothetical protein
VIDAAVNVTLLGLGDGALVPRPGGGELAGARQAGAHLVQASAEVPFSASVTARSYHGITANQTSPVATCSPCQPTRVKNADRKALRCGVGAGDHISEFADLEREERRPEREGDQSKEVSGG